MVREGMSDCEGRVIGDTLQCDDTRIDECGIDFGSSEC